jgi:hypothetical protein
LLPERANAVTSTAAITCAHTIETGSGQCHLRRTSHGAAISSPGGACRQPSVAGGAKAETYRAARKENQQRTVTDVECGEYHRGVAKPGIMRHHPQQLPEPVARRRGIR